jgi:hypothetical protein
MSSVCRRSSLDAMAHPSRFSPWRGGPVEIRRSFPRHVQVSEHQSGSNFRDKIAVSKPARNRDGFSSGEFVKAKYSPIEIFKINNHLKTFDN